MTTDWILLRRLAAELELALRGGRVDDAGLLADGRVALVLRRGKATTTLALDPFGSPPSALPSGDLPDVAADPGWVRAAAAALRGTRLDAVRALRGDRVLVFTFGTASRFGVTGEYRLVVELVPRYGNVVLVRERVVVAALKQFSPAENEARAVQVGMPYEPPPLPSAEPRLPRLLAEALAARGGGDAGALLAEAEAAASAGASIHVYRDGPRIVAAHVVPLAQFGALAHETAPSLVAVLAESRDAMLRERSGDATERRRGTLLARLAKRIAATERDEHAVAARIANAAERDVLRRSGDALFTHAHEIAPGATAYVPATDPELRIALDPALDAKENAQRYYARYRKAADALPHLERRITELRRRRETLDMLAFEAERADPTSLAEVEAALDVLEGRAPQRAAPPARKRPPLRIDRPSGARIIVGRSPRENDEVTFRIARPDDLWFHARGIPGSHVVLQPPPGRAPDDDDLDAAANLAAAHSKARHAARVEIDYTERKHVRKQRDAAAGLVWYTNARTRIGRPFADAAPTVTTPAHPSTSSG